MSESMYDMEGIRIAGKRRPGKEIQVEQPRDLARDSGQRKLTYSLQNHCASSRSVYLGRRLDSH